jgi:ribonuclease G
MHTEADPRHLKTQVTAPDYPFELIFSSTHFDPNIPQDARAQWVPEPSCPRPWDAGLLELFVGNEIIVNKTGRETRVALMENGLLAELHVDRGDKRGYVGNVYLGRVVRVLPGMQAAFVDIGLERAAFLYAGDIYPEFLDRNIGKEIDDPDATVVEAAPRATPRAGQPPIQDLIKEGQEVLVQVAKDPISTKGARIKTHITLPGRFTVFMPTVDHVGISRRIEKDRERRKLRDFVEKNRPKGAGFIVRTVCEGQQMTALKQDMDYLIATWKRIQEVSANAKAPAEIHADHGLVLRVVRDSFTDGVDRMVIDDKDLYESVQSFIKDFAPTLRDRVRLYRGAEPIYDTFGVETEINRSLGRKVWLKSGGYLIIDQTEALTAIDVNSGKYVGSSSLEDTTLAINLEAVQEIGYQLRLRNIGGIIVLDFIDMEKSANRERVYRAMEEQLRKDRARTNLLKISELGLIEMTRKRVQEDLVSSISEHCLYCSGTGSTRSRTTVVYDVLREIQREALRSRGRDTVFVNAHPTVADLMYSSEMDSVEALEKMLEKTIVVRAMGHYHLERYEVYSQ